MLRISQLKCQPGHTVEQLKQKAIQLLRIKEEELQQFTIIRQSIDARKKPDIFYSYTVDVQVKQEEKVYKKMKGKSVVKIEAEPYTFPTLGNKKLIHRPVVIGTGPAGLFCGYYLALHGYRPILLEQGADVDTRVKEVEAFWKGEPLQPDSNVQFGEGGAGTFSDGKLNTLVKDKDGRCKEVLNTFVTFGAKDSILYESKPHLGTDVLCGVVKQIREALIRLGGEVRFGSKVTDLRMQNGQITGVEVNHQEIIPSNITVLAIGHSARETFAMLYEKAIPMEAKSFAVGLRVEHPQSMINKSQYGMEDPQELGAAPYKVTAKTSSKRGVYSFCMCPGGYVVNASSEPGKLAVNGMSYSARDGKNANSAVIVAVTPQDFGSEHPLAGIAFQRKLEEKAYALGSGKIPVQHYGVFRQCVETGKTQEELFKMKYNINMKEIFPQNKGGCVFADVSQILPRECNVALVEGMEQFGRKIAGFNREDTILSGVESRTSSPVRILRGEDGQSAVKGLYPCGEGAGYAGGITSAAMDGLRMAELIAAEYQPLSS